jgi:hypothetical protein
VIMTQPSPHAKARDGGEYRWITTGDLPELRDEARAHLTAKAARGGQPVSITTRPELAAYLAAHTVDREPWRRKSFRDKYAHYRNNGERHHDAMMKVLYWAARQVHDDLVSSTIFDDLYDDWEASFGPNDRTPPTNEFARMLAEAITSLRLPRKTSRLYAHGIVATWVPTPAITSACSMVWYSTPKAKPKMTRNRSGQRATCCATSPVARARRVGLWAMLGHVLARAVARDPAHGGIAAAGRQACQPEPVRGAGRSVRRGQYGRLRRRRRRCGHWGYLWCGTRIWASGVSGRWIPAP